MSPGHEDLSPIMFESFTMRGGGREWRFVAPVDPLAVLHALSTEQCAKDKFQPYWAERWPATWVTFDFLSRLQIPAHALVCEIGCGVGSVSAMLGARGPHVVAVDISFPGCALTLRNARFNQSSVHALCCDWRQPSLKRRFDVIVGSEILYEERFIEPVLDFINAYLADGGVAYIADPCRPFWSRFKQTATKRGFDVRLLHEEIVNDGKTIVEIVGIRALTVPAAP